MATTTQQQWDVLDVLTRAGDARESFAAAVGEQVDELDALLVSDVLAASRRVGETIALRRSLVDLCALLRAIDAAEHDLIDLRELRDGLRLHAARTDRFEHFADARVLLRTLGELLERDPRAAGREAVRGQVALLHRELREYLQLQLTGDANGSLPARAIDQAPPESIVDPQLARHAHDLVEELLHGARHHPVTGLLGAAWVRGWSAVPIAGEQLGEDDPHELDRLVAALGELEPTPPELLLVDLRRSRRWQLHGRTLQLRDGLRASRVLPATRAGLGEAAAERSGWCVLTTRELEFAIVEGAGHHALLGPTDFVTAACGCTPLEAVARFREHVEQLAEHDEDPPADLLDVAERFGRLRRRSR